MHRVRPPAALQPLYEAGKWSSSLHGKLKWSVIPVKPASNGGQWARWPEVKDLGNMLVEGLSQLLPAAINYAPFDRPEQPATSADGTRQETYTLLLKKVL